MAHLKLAQPQHIQEFLVLIVCVALISWYLHKLHRFLQKKYSLRSVFTETRNILGVFALIIVCFLEGCAGMFTLKGNPLQTFTDDSK